MQKYVKKAIQRSYNRFGGWIYSWRSAKPQQIHYTTVSTQTFAKSKFERSNTFRIIQCGKASKRSFDREILVFQNRVLIPTKGRICSLNHARNYREKNRIVQFLGLITNQNHTTKQDTRAFSTNGREPHFINFVLHFLTLYALSPQFPFLSPLQFSLPPFHYVPRDFRKKEEVSSLPVPSYYVS